jgi:hypothetical protein
MLAIQSRMMSAMFFVLFGLANHTLAANECDYYKEGVEHYEKLRRMGGNIDEMNYWTSKGHELEDKLYHCRRDANINPVIQTTTDNPPPDQTTIPKRQHMPLVRSFADDPQLQRLIKTCNYWITQTNENASQDNINFRDTACRAVNNHQNAQESPSTATNITAVRKLKDCIKPDNRIDNDVNECVKGNIEPIWRK